MSSVQTGGEPATEVSSVRTLDMTREIVVIPGDALLMFALRGGGAPRRTRQVAGGVEAGPGRPTGRAGTPGRWLASGRARSC
jgi:hypothetical protein